MKLSVFRSTVFFIFLLAGFSSLAQTTFNPVTPAKGFNIFTSGNIIAKAGDTHGPVAMGGDLVLNGNTIFTMNTSGTYPTGVANDADNYGMVIRGRVTYTSGNNSQMNRGVIRIGNTTGSSLYYTQNNAPVNFKITPGDFNSSPNIQTQRPQPQNSATLPDGLDFAAAFTQLKINSSKITSLGAMSCTSKVNKIVIPSTQNPHITLVDNKVNLVDITGAQLNALAQQGSIIFDNKPTASRPLVFNITAGGSFTWNVFNPGGLDESDGAFIIYNFYTATGLALTGGPSIYGTVLAPSADIVKSGANNNNGQILGKSVEVGYGEVHYYLFAGVLPDCPAGTVVAVNGLQVSAALTGNSVTLNWKAIAENDIVRYQAERSLDAMIFSAITIQNRTINGNGNYSFMETLPANAGKVYYRIRSENISGNYAYSNVAIVKNSQLSSFEIWPVPARDVLNVYLKSGSADRAMITISDNSGRVVLNDQRAVVTGSNQFSMNVDKLSKGFYILRITNASGIKEIRKFVKE